MKLRSFLIAAALATVPVTMAAPAAYAQKAPIYTGLFSNEALQGYDTVAYFTENDAVKGSDEFTTEYMGAEWKFASQENLDKFLADPEAYAPQYGGYCAWAVSQGNTAKGDARVWHIHEGKLYLNVNRGIQRRWLADKEAFIEQANNEWPGVLN